MTLFSDASGRKIVSTTTAQTVGKVDDFVVDPATRAVVALTVKKADHGDTLAWRDLTAFGVDAVTVGGAEAITRPNDHIAGLRGKDNRLVGKRVLSTRGDELGKVKDVAFDPETAAITVLRLEESEADGSLLVGVGSYAVVVQSQLPDR